MHFHKALNVEDANAKQTASADILRPSETGLVAAFLSSGIGWPEKAHGLDLVMWIPCAEGSPRRRMVFWGSSAGSAPMISDGMAAAAMMYRRVWSLWRNNNGLPRRTVQVSDACRARSGSGWRADGDLDRRECQQDIVISRLFRGADRAVRSCTHGELVRQVIDVVVCDGFCPPPLLERRQALSALRDGLQALEVYFGQVTAMRGEGHPFQKDHGA